MFHYIPHISSVVLRSIIHSITYNYISIQDHRYHIILIHNHIVLDVFSNHIYNSKIKTVFDLIFLNECYLLLSYLFQSFFKKILYRLLFDLFLSFLLSILYIYVLSYILIYTHLLKPKSRYDGQIQLFKVIIMITNYKK